MTVGPPPMSRHHRAPGGRGSTRGAGRLPPGIIVSCAIFRSPPRRERPVRPQRRGLLQRRRQAHQASLAGRLPADPRRQAGQSQRSPPAGRGLPRHDRRGVQAALLRRQGRARRSGHHRERRAGPGRRRRAVQPAGGQLLPAGGRADAGRAGGPGRLPAGARRALRLLSPAASGARQPRPGPPGASRGDEPRRRSPCSRRRTPSVPPPGCPNCRPPSRSARRWSSATTPSTATKSCSGRSTRTACMLVGDEWYLLGYCHLRQAIRTFRLSRIRSRISHATKAPHDFAPPAGFTLAAYRDRPAWQLDGRLHQALIRVGSSMAWWVQAHYSHCGEIDAAGRRLDPLRDRIWLHAGDGLVGARPRRGGRDHLAAGPARRRCRPARAAAAAPARPARARSPRRRAPGAAPPPARLRPPATGTSKSTVSRA